MNDMNYNDFDKLVAKVKARKDFGDEGGHQTMLISLGLMLDDSELESVKEDLSELGIKIGQMHGLNPWDMDMLDDRFSWSERFCD